MLFESSGTGRAYCAVRTMATSSEGAGSRNLGNRRAHRRAALTSPVLIDSARSHHTGRCRDVSEGGLLVELETELPVGTPVDLYFELPTGVSIEARAEVLRSATSTLGLRFEALSTEHRRAVSSYCETWRAALLSKCARRQASVPDQRLTASALTSGTQSGSPMTDYESSEQSDVRIRVADDLRGAPAPAPKPKLG